MDTLGLLSSASFFIILIVWIVLHTTVAQELTCCDAGVYLQVEEVVSKSIAIITLAFHNYSIDVFVSSACGPLDTV